MLEMNSWSLEDAKYVFNYAKRLFGDKATEKILIADCWHARKYGRTVSQCNYWKGFPYECRENEIESTLEEELDHLSNSDKEAFEVAKSIEEPVIIDREEEFFDDRFDYVYHDSHEKIQLMKTAYFDIHFWYCFTREQIENPE